MQTAADTPDVVTTARGGERLKEAVRAALQAPRDILQASRATQTPAQFAAREVFSRIGSSPTRRWNDIARPRTVYTLKDGAAIAVEHGTEDAWVMADVIRRGGYAAPYDVDLRAIQSAPQRPVVVDLGGHIGCFGVFAQERYRPARIVSYEPDPRNGEAIEVAARSAHCPWEVRHAAAGTAAATARFASGRSSRSGIADHGDIDVTVLDCFEDLRAADILKLDCEGAEWAILADPRFGELEPLLVVLEYHLEDADADESGHQAGARVRSLIEPQGYDVRATRAITRRSGLVWATKRRAA